MEAKNWKKKKHLCAHNSCSRNPQTHSVENSFTKYQMEDDIQIIANSLGVKRKNVIEMTVDDLKEECAERSLKVRVKS